MKPDIVRRYSQNPILTKRDIPYPVETVHNAAVVKHRNKYIMLFRSHLRTGRSIIGLARSPDGFHFIAAPRPSQLGPPGHVLARGRVRSRIDCQSDSVKICDVRLVDSQTDYGPMISSFSASSHMN